jgi:hypothetical protein
MNQWHAPLDPECRAARQFIEALFLNAITSAIGAPTDDIVEGFEAKHRATCARCQEFGAANIEIV